MTDKDITEYIIAWLKTLNGNGIEITDLDLVKKQLQISENWGWTELKDQVCQ